MGDTPNFCIPFFFSKVRRPAIYAKPDFVVAAMVNASTIQRDCLVTDSVSSVRSYADLRRHTSLNVWSDDEDAAAVVVSDVFGSTAMWCADDEGMAHHIVANNRRFRQVLEAMNRATDGRTQLVKINEIGDSWVVAARGPCCCRLAVLFAEAMLLRTVMPLHVGVHFAAFSIVRLNRYDGNGFVPQQYECFGLNRVLLDEVKLLERGCAEGGVRCSGEVFEQLSKEDLSELPPSCIAADRLLPCTVPIQVDGYVLFLVARSGRLPLLDSMCAWGASRPNHLMLKVVSIEDEGRVWSILSHSHEALREWFDWAGRTLHWPTLKASIVRSDRIWSIHDQSDAPFQRFERYVSGAQNVAARLVMADGGWGEVRSNEASTLRAALPRYRHCPLAPQEYQGADLEVHSATLTEPPMVGWGALFSCGAFGAKSPH